MSQCEQVKLEHSSQGSTWKHCILCAHLVIDELRKQIAAEEECVRMQANRIRDLVSENVILNQEKDGLNATILGLHREVDRLNGIIKEMRTATTTAPEVDVALDHRIAQLKADLVEARREQASVMDMIRKLPPKDDQLTNNLKFRIEMLERRTCQMCDCDDAMRKEINETDEAAEELAHRVEELEDIIKQAQAANKI